VRVVVLGAGLAGLATAERILLQGAVGLSVTVLEAATRPGGPVSTIREDGFVLERGPNTLRTNRESDVLLTRLGLDGEVVRPDEHAPRWIYRNGAPRSVIPGPQGLFTKALRFGEKLRVLGDLSVPKRRADLEDESVHDFFERRFGAGLARYAAGPMVSGVYATTRAPSRCGARSSRSGTPRHGAEA
jgi:oxygen-dependent protoporphyrinogen oxidase